MKNREDRDIISMFSSTPKLSNVRPQRYSLLKYVDTCTSSESRRGTTPGQALRPEHN